MAFEPTVVRNPKNLNPFSGPAVLSTQQPGPLCFGNKMKKFLLLSIAALVLSGCANSRIVYAPEIDNQGNFSELFVLCNIAYIGSGVFTNLTIDGVEVAEFYGGNYVHLKLNPGIHTISALTPHNIMTLKINLEPQKKYYLDATYIRKKGSLPLPEIKQSIAEKQISKLKKVE